MSKEHQEPNKREQDVFVEALEFPVEQRASYLDLACGDDHALRSSVDALLKNHRDDDLLEQIGIPSQPNVQTGEQIGDKIGPYKLLEKIGEGGWGIVYKAEQQGSVHRQVALKVVKLGMDTKPVISRFKAEIDALARLEHSNIARVYAAGTTKEGRPYFAMELARGPRITDYCDSHQLTLYQRLELFQKVCHGVQHAHQHGIIHRDIKPANVLVIEEDDKPLPKVIDFGISKVSAGERSSDTAFVTATGQVIGTIAYMSPEQAGSDRQIESRTDIYSLGLLLYELLVGYQPFNLSGLGRYEQLRTIVESQPAKPSARFSELAAVEKLRIAQCRRTEPADVIRSLQAGLDSIVLKCLEKNRELRYKNANGLADDIQRYLKRQEALRQNPNGKRKIKYVVVSLFIVFITLAFVSAFYSRHAQLSEGEAIRGVLNQGDRILQLMAVRVDDSALDSDPQIEVAHTFVDNAYHELKNISADSCPPDFVKDWSEYLKSISVYSETLAAHPQKSILSNRAFREWQEKVKSVHNTCDTLYRALKSGNH